MNGSTMIKAGGDRPRCADPSRDGVTRWLIHAASGAGLLHPDAAVYLLDRLATKQSDDAEDRSPWMAEWSDRRAAVYARFGLDATDGDTAWEEHPERRLTEPPEIGALQREFEARREGAMDRTLRAMGLDATADLRRDNRAEYERRVAAGGRWLFGDASARADRAA